MKAYRECVEMRTALAEEFRELKPLFAALGDENRQQIFLNQHDSSDKGCRNENGNKITDVKSQHAHLSPAFAANIISACCLCLVYLCSFCKN